MNRLLYFSVLLLATLVLTGCGTTGATAGEAPTDTERFGGLALYTLRDTMAKDPRGVLRSVADLGYEYIEAAGYADGKFYGMEPKEFRAYLKEVDLRPMSTHHGDVTLDNADEYIAAAKAAGFEYFVIPVPPMGHFTFDPATNSLGMSGTVAEVSDIINEIAAKCAAAGIKCLYHNHDFEFVENEEGIVPIDYFLEHSDPDQLNFQMDLYWVTKAGADPIDYFDRYPGRFTAWHVKDMDAQGRFAPVGTGSIDFQRIVDARQKSGMKFFLVEQDMTFGRPPLEAIEISHRALKGIGLGE